MVLIGTISISQKNWWHHKKIILPCGLFSPLNTFHLKIEIIMLIFHKFSKLKEIPNYMIKHLTFINVKMNNSHKIHFTVLLKIKEKGNLFVQKITNSNPPAQILWIQITIVFSDKIVNINAVIHTLLIPEMNISIRLTILVSIQGALIKKIIKKPFVLNTKFLIINWVFSLVLKNTPVLIPSKLMK